MCLVQVHAQVCSVAEPLLDRTLNVMVEELAGEALRCIRQIRRFGMGGMLRVRFSFHNNWHLAKRQTFILRQR